MRYANQSVTLPELLDGLAGLIQAALRLNSENVVEWHSPGRPSADLPSTRQSSYVWFRFVDAAVDNEANALRYGMPVVYRFAVNLVTRNFQDGAQRDKRAGRQHLLMRLLLENALFGQMLHPYYRTAVGDALPVPLQADLQTPLTGEWVAAIEQQRRLGTEGIKPAVLSLAPMTCEELPAHERPRPEQGQLETHLGVGIKAVLRLSLGELEELQNGQTESRAQAASLAGVDGSGDFAGDTGGFGFTSDFDAAGGTAGEQPPEALSVGPAGVGLERRSLADG